ncbi:hypothetical protein [Shinella sp.]|uniref:hypothetical protein n=1 Tax=Shinella sp. TaxID=1870904 RepID=UPI0028A92E5A|nr:hypothetical protein [Shinella sp.]
MMQIHNFWDVICRKLFVGFFTLCPIFAATTDYALSFLDARVEFLKIRAMLADLPSSMFIDNAEQPSMSEEDHCVRKVVIRINEIVLGNRQVLNRIEIVIREPAILMRQNINDPASRIAHFIYASDDGFAAELLRLLRAPLNTVPQTGYLS